MTTPETAVASDHKATSETAEAPKVEVQGKTEEPKKGKPGSTKRLFPGWTQNEAGRAVPPAQETAKEEKPTETTAETDKPTPQVTDEVIDPEIFKGKKLKLKLDGKEEVIPVEDAIKNIQLEKHLTQKSQSLADREHQLNEREKLLRLQTEAAKPAAPQTPTEDLTKESVFADDPLIKRLLERDAAREREMEEFRRSTAKIRYEDNLKALSENIRATTGYDDFMTYRERVEKAFNSLPAEMKKAADNAEWWTNKYLVLKNSDLRSELEKARSEKPAPTPPARREGGPMTGISGTTGGSVGSEALQTWEAKYNVAFARAKESGDRDDWAEVFRLKKEGTSIK